MQRSLSRTSLKTSRREVVGWRSTRRTSSQRHHRRNLPRDQGSDLTELFAYHDAKTYSLPKRAPYGGVNARWAPTAPDLPSDRRMIASWRRPRTGSVGSGPLVVRFGGERLGHAGLVGKAYKIGAGAMWMVVGMFAAFVFNWFVLVWRLRSDSMTKNDTYIKQSI